MKPNFHNLTIKELKKYVLDNRDDLEAFRILVDRIDQQPVKQIYNEASLENFSQLLKEHQKSKGN